MVPTHLRATNAQTALAIALFNLPLHVEKGESSENQAYFVLLPKKTQNVNIITQTFFSNINIFNNPTILYFLRPLANFQLITL